MANVLDPEANRRQPSRPLKEIAMDILQFPLDKPAGVVFDSSMRKGVGSNEHHLGNLLRDKIENAEFDGGMGGQSLLQRLQAKKVPRKMVEKPDPPQVVLANSVGAMEKMIKALDSISQTGKASTTDQAVIRTVAWPMVDLLAQVEADTAAGIRSHSGDGIGEALLLRPGAATPEARDAAKKKAQEQDAEAIANFEGNARNLQEIKPLLDELAKGLNMTLVKTIAKSGG